MKDYRMHPNGKTWAAMNMYNNNSEKIRAMIS